MKSRLYLKVKQKTQILAVFSTFTQHKHNTRFIHMWVSLESLFFCPNDWKDNNK